MENPIYEINKSYVMQIENIITNRDWTELKKLILTIPPPDLAEIYSGLNEKYNFLFFRNLPTDIAADVFSHLDPEEQQELLTKFTGKQTKGILAELDPDDRTAFLEELPGDLTRKLLNLLSSEDLKEARQLLGYPEDSVGRNMTPDYVAVKKDLTVKKAIEYIRKYGKDKETINVIYVIDESKHLIGEFRIRNLILADTQKKISDIMNKVIVTLSAFNDQEKAVTALQQYDKIAIPVVDSKNTIVGIVTFDDVMDIAEEEVTEDIQKSSSVSPLETDYSQAKVWKLYIKRIGWLLFLLITGFFTSKIISFFEGVLAARVVLAFFIPVLLASGGNTGAQITTLVIRAIATRDIELTDWFKIFIKELLLGLFLGSTLAFFSFVLAAFIGSDIKIGIIVGTSMIFIVLWANLIGALLPILITKMHFDPALVSNPLITTIVDISGLLIYFYIGTMLLGI
ncbi:magnesium transporter [Spirochaetota bacterium]